MQEVEFLNKQYGCKAILKTKATPEIVAKLRQRNVVGLELNTAKGWHGDLHFLTEMTSLKELVLLQIGSGEIDLTPIQKLTNLVHLELSTYSQNNIDFALFPNLSSCSLEWQPGFSSIFNVSDLKQLFLSNYSSSSSEEFAKLGALEELSIKNTSIKELAGISQLRNLRRLEIGLAKNLESLAGVEHLSKLEELEINNCKRLSSLAPVSSLKHLRSILVLDCGDIDSLRPVDGLPNLKRVMFYGSTNVIDGDLSPITRLIKPIEVAFQERKHYSHKRQDFIT
jgi:hypothetical protein